MKRLFIFATVGTALLGAASLSVAQPAPTAGTGYVLKFHLSDGLDKEVPVKEDGKFNLSFANEGVNWTLQGTSTKRDNGFGLNVDIASKQETAKGSANGHIQASTSIQANGRPVKLGTVSTSINGAAKTYNISATLTQKN